MNIGGIRAAGTRRRVLMAGANKAGAHIWKPLGTPVAVAHINALVYGTPEVLEEFSKFTVRDDTGEEPEGVIVRYQDDTQELGTIYCLDFPQNTFISCTEAQYEAEAIEVEFVLSDYGDGLILTCGNGQDNLIAVQLRVTGDGALYVKTFQAEETAEFELHGEMGLSPHCRVVLRLERHGNRGRVSVNRGGGHDTAEPLFELNIAGTDPAAFDPSMEFAGFDSGLVLTDQTAHIAKITWWHL